MAILVHAQGPFNNYVTLTRVGGVPHFFPSIVKSIVINNRLALQKGGWVVAKTINLALRNY